MGMPPPVYDTTDMRSSHFISDGARGGARFQASPPQVRGNALPSPDVQEHDDDDYNEMYRDDLYLDVNWSEVCMCECNLYVCM